ncbi:MAG: RES family NAD+ phosphorylase [Azoarcus sp.]|jgi:RES domain-containing protein|nr:RES family NAD+ phosphorylase [Azoarcus sp.]
MILCDLPAGTTLFRALTPQWASSPTSGAGAAAKGGRFNRDGIEALYLSLDEMTALREYQQTSPFLPPCTMCSYAVALQGLVDLRQLHHGAPWDDLWHDWREDWRHLKLDQHIEPPTWVLGDMVRAHGYTGILFPSQVCNTGFNVAVYLDRLTNGNSITVNDPDGRLPRDQSSWVGRP